jgi:Flp pilus assembly protein TadD
MKRSSKKWVGFGACLVLTGAGSLALLKVMPRTEAPATRPHTTLQGMPAAENPAHELKELAVQLTKKPGHTPILMRMAQIQREAGRLDESIAELREVTQNEPGYAEAHLELGRALYEKGDVQGGITETEKVLQINPNQVDALYNLGAIYANLGNVERARLYWTKAVSADPNADSSRKARDGLNKIGAA